MPVSVPGSVGGSAGGVGVGAAAGCLTGVGAVVFLDDVGVGAAFVDSTPYAVDCEGPEPVGAALDGSMVLAAGGALDVLGVLGALGALDGVAGALLFAAVEQPAATKAVAIVSAEQARRRGVLRRP